MDAHVFGITQSLTGKSWVWRPGQHERQGEGLAQQLGVPDLMGRLLAARGVTADHAANFLDPTLRAMLPDPSSMVDMDSAAVRLADAVMQGEMVGVFGDYDVDGACSSALMITLLRQLGCPVTYHVPDRLAEGYGPNAEALRAMVERGARLIVCVDCGTAAHSAFAPLHNAVDIVVLDHHKSEGPPPPIRATVNPNRLDCPSGLRQICAAAVAFLTAVALLRTLRRRGFFAERVEPDLREFLDLVALATVCDVMPLVGLNRAFVIQGLKVMARRARPGIAALLDVTKLTEAPTAMNCGFALGPRINASGRIAEADMGLRLLLAEDEGIAFELAQTLDAVNRQRQTVEAGISSDAMARAEAQAAGGHGIILLAQEGWHPGVVGIVAGRVKERFNRPALVAGITDGMAKGSGRSVPGIDLGAAVIAARQSGILATGGGHAMAAGFSAPETALSTFHEFLNDRLASAALLPPSAELVLDGVLGVAGADAGLAQMVSRLGPFGSGNEEPLFVLPRARVVKADRIGKDGNTIRVMVEGEGGGRLKALLFRAKEGPLAEALSRVGGAPLHLAGHLRAEFWRGRVSAGFFIADAAPA
ncbi:single-stranded-DNA-specific exonuclease RecJ [Acidocella aminolytica]|jgi:single-stranded-DNA-specific exonuclease|uniref:Single-stranded-DNA-specific exonuclease RecJ n=1 Tax=Acidocella aminolytica 101 = DSM 11237 TaxID=1120923 RepID=A0A0D6PGQ2_9PROT|nr:single-stranded-DNA-specific exonuclease RecJ [Acidocella aminolytica]GAN80556.1 single-stranded-DNA-specific exonuclease RecJ [Acidocella aminolytica 101 = DSM 11237]GBQ43050.1 single-stranded-DNA-specific exonuclease RecJ [Acidocella aminolytica 101 = DSM 11237]SHE28972.1 single-stranded-DNA-specific exonuclease [Acidocella aminolytica 101 = DSM 11237]